MELNSYYARNMQILRQYGLETGEDKPFEVRQKWEYDVITFEPDKELKEKVRVFDSNSKKQKDEVLRSSGVDFQEKDVSRAVLGIHSNYEMAFKTSGVTSYHQSLLNRFLYKTKIQLFQSSERPTENCYLWQTVNHKYIPNGGADGTGTTINVSGYKADDYAVFDIPWKFAADNTKYIEVYFPSGLTTMEAASSAVFPYYDGATQAHGSKNTTSLSTAGQAYYLELWYNVIEWRLVDNL